MISRPLEYLPRFVDEDPKKSKNFDSELLDVDGNTLFKQEGIIAPANWSQLSVDIFAQKYFRRSGVPLETTVVTSEGLPVWISRRVAAQYTAFGGESSVYKVVRRLAGGWVNYIYKQALLADTKLNNHHVNLDNPYKLQEALTILDESMESLFWDIQNSMLQQCWAPNSPQWFNTGLYWAYGITGEASGHWHEAPKGSKSVVVESVDSYSRPQCHACFIQEVEDTLLGDHGIMDLVVREARLFKLGSGSGANYSNIREKGAPLSGGGVSSGLSSFLEIPDVAAGAIKSGGTTRRAARMVSLDLNHPESQQFISWKATEEDKAMCLALGSKVYRESIRAVYREHTDLGFLTAREKQVLADIDPKVLHRATQALKTGIPLSSLLPPAIDLGWEGTAYKTISGQNANNSIRITDEFMDTLLADTENPADFKFTSRVGGREAVETKSHKAIWDDLVKSAWLCGDPGIQFHDTTNRANTCLHSGTIRASNPCSEYLWFADTACNLASINLMKCLEKDHTGVYCFFTEKLQNLVRMIVRVLDATVSYAQYPYESMASESLKYRTIGIGVSNLGALLITLGIPYGSKEGRDLAAAIMSIIQGTACLESMSLAAELGSFPAFEFNKDAYLEVLEQTYTDTFNLVVNTSIFPGYSSRDIYLKAREVWTDVHTAMHRDDFAMRNAQLTAIAPTGTISLIMGCSTSSIEPGYSLVTSKKLAGGGEIITEASDEVKNYISDIMLDTQTADDIIEQINDGVPICDVVGLEGHNYANDVLACALDITPTNHILMCAAIQPFVSGGISKTINMPSNATLRQVGEAFKLAYREGLKSITVYRDGSKFSQPLTSLVETVVPATKGVPVVTSGVPVTEARLSALSTSKEPAPKMPLPAVRVRLPNVREGVTHKITTGGMTFYLRTGVYEDGSLGEIFLSTAKSGSTFRGILDAFAWSISVGLQYGIPLSVYAASFTGTLFEPNGFIADHPDVKMCGSILDAIFKILVKHYDGRHTETQDKFTGEPCSTCGHFKLVSNGSCKICRNCGTTTGCS